MSLLRPDYKLYLSPNFIETEKDFNEQKHTMAKVGDVKTFDRFALNLPHELDLSQYNTVIVWCETFGEFITSARLSSQCGSKIGLRQPINIGSLAPCYKVSFSWGLPSVIYLDGGAGDESFVSCYRLSTDS